MNDNRRSDDQRITQLGIDQGHLHDCVESLKAAVKENTEITEQVRDILASFRVVGAVAKWIAAIAGAVGATIATVKAWK